MTRLDPTRALGAGTRLIARFGVIGLASFVIDIGGYNLLRSGLDLGPLWSKTLSVVLATTFAFVGNKAWTFDERTQQRHVGAEYAVFVAINGVALLIGLACLVLSTYVLGLTSPLAENLSTNVVGVGLGTLFRFWAYQRWVFPRAATELESELVEVGLEPHPHLHRPAA